MLCSVCGEGELLQDDHGAESTLVCTQCGCISSDAANSSLSTTEYTCGSSVGKSLNTNFRVNLKDKSSRQRYHMRKFLADIERCVCQYTKSSDSIINASKDLFFKVIYDNSLQHKKVSEKLRIAAACTYIILRQNNITVTIKSLSDVMGSPLSGMNKTLALVKRLTNHVTPRFEKHDVTSFMSSLPCTKTNNDLVKKSLEMYNLLKKMFLTQGRDIVAVSHVSVYFAFVSRQKKSKKYTLFPIFCKSNDMKPTTALKVFVKTCQERLLVLAERLPWMRDKTRKINQFHLFIDDILLYQDTLLKGGPNPTEYKESEIENTRMPLAFLKKTKLKELTSSVEIPAASTSEIITEDDLPESEMINYIRTADEIKQIKSLKDFLPYDAVG